MSAVPHLNLGKFLKEKRVDAGYTQIALAAELKNVHSQYVSNWERGACVPPSHCFQKIIQLLKIDRRELVDMMLEDCRKKIESQVYKKRGKSA